MGKPCVLRDCFAATPILFDVINSGVIKLLNRLVTNLACLVLVE